MMKGLNNIHITSHVLINFNATIVRMNLEMYQDSKRIDFFT